MTTAATRPPAGRLAPPGGGSGRLRVAVVFGGRSSEHAISCLTARGVLAALDPARYDVVPVGITRDGRWVLEAADPGRQAVAAGALPEVDATAAEVLLPPGSRSLTLTPPGEPPRAVGDVDVVLPLLHGPFGEDGTLQGLLEMAGVRYVGSGVLASAVAMDKAVAKTVLAAAGVPVGAWAVLAPGEVPDPDSDEIAALGMPLFVKPARGGSSVGISRVTDPGALPAAVAAAAVHDPRVVLEAAVSGREVECGVLARLDGDPEASVVGEIAVGGPHAFYDFEAKYTETSATRLTVPAELDGATAQRVRELSVRAFTALGCEGLARVDFFLTPDGGLVLNEVNTMPGFTEHSMFPRLWAAAGLDYPALLDRLLAVAAARPVGLR